MESKIEEAPKPSSNQSPSSNRLRTITILSILLVLAIIFAIILSLTLNRKTPQIEETIFENEVCYCCSIEKRVEMERHRLGRIVDKDIGGFCEIQSIYINDIPFEIYIPHNATMSLCVGSIDHNDKDIVYATQAADVRADNGGIVGAFVLKGKPLAWGLSKKGYCASIDGNVYVGVAENSPLFEEATEKDGYFFRQYPLVKDGIPVHNNLRGKSIRRAICERNGEIFMVATSTPESFHDFIQALVDFGIDQAVYLVGSSAIGWAVNEDGTINEWGDKETILGDKRLKNISYIVWKKNK
jgi:hypothetical protein